jgi:hypothetical protein
MQRILMRCCVCSASTQEHAMADTKTPTPQSDDKSRRESGLPGGGKGRKDETSKHGIFPYSVRAQAPKDVDPELRTPASLTDAPQDEAGESSLEDVYYSGTATKTGESPPKK